VNIHLILKNNQSNIGCHLRCHLDFHLALGVNAALIKLRRVIDNIHVILFGINQPRAFLKSSRIVATTYADTTYWGNWPYWKVIS
jgi:hypothetical protein